MNAMENRLVMSKYKYNMTYGWMISKFWFERCSDLLSWDELKKGGQYRVQGAG